MSDSLDIVGVMGVEPPPLVALAYLSTPTVAFSDRDLSDLLLAARSWNVRNEITGKLIVLEDGDRIARFAQWIEGPPLQMEACIGRILGDPRHGEFEIRHRGAVEGRRFPGWDLAIHPAEDASFMAEAKGLMATTDADVKPPASRSDGAPDGARTLL